MGYQALYRKYRPSCFGDVLGQENIVRTLKNQIISGKVSHAYLFCGTRGTGKTSVAKIFAKVINCLSPKDGEPCGACVSCKGISDGSSLNVIEIDAASNNGVDNIRDLREEVRYAPTEGKYKVYIIDEVHMLTGGAYNALLKTLEEPPSHVVFILATTDPQKIPATIHSRCQRYDFKRISARQIKDRIFEYLLIEKVKADDEAIAYIARHADGSMRDALSLLDRCITFYEAETITLSKVLEVTGSIDSKSFFELTERLNDMDSSGALSIVSKMMDDGRDIGQIIVEALSHFRSILIAKSAENAAYILDISDEMVDEIKAQSEMTDSVRLMSYITAFSELAANTKYAGNPGLLLEIEVIKLTNPEIVNNSYEEILGKILKLEKDIENGVPARNIAQDSAPQAAEEKKTKVKKVKVALPSDFKMAKQKFPDIKKKLGERPEALPFLGILDRAEMGFLDDKFLYIIFDDETNENILKNDEKRQKLLDLAITEVTGLSFPYRTITKAEFEQKSKGIELTEAKEKKSEAFADSVIGGLGGIEGFKVEYED